MLRTVSSGSTARNSPASIPRSTSRARTGTARSSTSSRYIRATSGAVIASRRTTFGTIATPGWSSRVASMVTKCRSAVHASPGCSASSPSAASATGTTARRTSPSSSAFLERK